MKIFDDLDGMIVKIVDLLYAENDRIEISPGKINGIDVPWHVYKAVAERIKYNADLHGDRFAPGAESRILLDFRGKPRNFKVILTEDDGLLLERTI